MQVAVVQFPTAGAYALVFGIGSAAALVALLVAVFIPGDEVRPQDQPLSETEPDRIRAAP
jgi:hypothetical protein